MVTGGGLSCSCRLGCKTGRQYPSGRLALPHVKKCTFGYFPILKADSPVRLICSQSHKPRSRRRGERGQDSILFFLHPLLSSPKMGLSGRKIKQRIPQDPRNLSWADGNINTSFVSSTFAAQPSVHRCVSLWFYISIQAGLRSYRQKCYPRSLRSRSHPASQGKVCAFLRERPGLSCLCPCTGAPQTRHARYRSATHEGS